MLTLFLTLVVSLNGFSASLKSEMNCLEKSESVALHGKDSGEISVDLNSHRAAVASQAGPIYVYSEDSTYACTGFDQTLARALFLKAGVGNVEVALLYYGRNFKRPNHFSDTYPRVEFTTMPTISATSKNERDLASDNNGYERAFAQSKVSCHIDAGTSAQALLRQALRTRIDTLNQSFADPTRLSSVASKTRYLGALESCASVSDLHDLVEKKKTEIESIRP